MISGQRDIHALEGVARLLANQVALYARAEEIADDAMVRATLSSAAENQDRLLAEVARKIVEMGARAPGHGDALGAAQRIILNARTYLEDDDRAALGETERGEDFLRDQIVKRLVHGDLSAHAHNFLSTVLSRIEPVHDEVAHLKHLVAGRSGESAVRLT